MNFYLQKIRGGCRAVTVQLNDYIRSRTKSFCKRQPRPLWIKNKQPKELVDLPAFPLDALEAEWTGGDLCIQACADDLQVAFHAVRNLIRIARGKATLKWAQTGFQRTKQADSKNETPRNLFGFKDGTVNPNVDSDKQLNQHVWVQSGDGPEWLVNGSYLVVRRIQMFIEVWDRTNLREQENTFGRYRDSGAPLGQKGEFDQLDFKHKRKMAKTIFPQILMYDYPMEMEASRYSAEPIRMQTEWI